jgi:hypothetical protein
MLFATTSHAAESAADDLCRDHAFTVSGEPVQSRWQEHGRSGETLLTERGQLLKAGTGWRATCGHWALNLYGSRAAGHRYYTGVSNLRQPVETTSEIRTHELDAQLWHAWGQAWDLGARYLWRTSDRDLKSVGPVQGYLERYNQTALAFGLQHSRDLPSLGRVQSRIWMGSGLQGKLHVTLPGMDAAVLPLGRMHYWAAGVQWSGCRTGATGAGWLCEVAMDYQEERSAHGAAQALYNNGVLRASASQPATRQQSFTFKLGAHYRFN